MSKAIFNLDALVKVEISDREESRDLNMYCPAVKKSFWRKAKPVLYTGILMGYYTAEELTSDNNSIGVRFIIENNTVFHRPYVRLSFAGGYNKIIRFDTHEEALIYGESRAAESINSPLIFES